MITMISIVDELFFVSFSFKTMKLVIKQGHNE